MKGNFVTKLKHASPTLLTAASIVGVVTTAVLTARASFKAADDLSSANPDTTEEKVKVAWKHYIPPVVTGAATVVCICGIDILGKKQQAAIASAYALAESSYREYQNKVKELYGEETHQNIMDSIVKDHCKDVYLQANDGFGFSSLDFDEHDQNDIRLFYDEYSKRYFESSISRVLQAEYHINRNFVVGCAVTVNDFYEFLGLDPIKNGDDFGWTMCDDNELMWIDFNNYKVTLEDDLEVCVIQMVFDPVKLFA